MTQRAGLRDVAGQLAGPAGHDASVQRLDLVGQVIGLCAEYRPGGKVERRRHTGRLYAAASRAGNHHRWAPESDEAEAWTFRPPGGTLSAMGGPHSVAAGSICDVPGIRVGQATAERGPTGCTVILCPPGGAIAGVDVRGAAPGTRETDLLRPECTVEHVHAILLTGGSAFGLDAATGVMRYLEA